MLVDGGGVGVGVGGTAACWAKLVPQIPKALIVKQRDRNRVFIDFFSIEALG